MPTAQDLISETKRHLLSLQRESLNRLASAATSSQTTLTLEFDTTTVQQGSHLQLGLELMYVWTVDQASKSVTVQRAQLGSVAQAHSLGAVITVNPKFPDFAILKALNDDIRSLSAPTNGLYAVRVVELTGTANSSGYNLPGTTNLLEIISVEQRHAGNPRTWTTLTNFRLQQNAETDDFPGGIALHLAEGVRPGQPVRVLYKGGFSPLTNLTDDVETVAGLTSDLQDIPPMGAAVRMVAPREIKRNFTESQGEPRRATEVPPGAVGGSMRGVAQWREQRIQQEASRLAQRFPDGGFIPPQMSVW